LFKILDPTKNWALTDLRAAEIKGAAGFFDASVAQALAQSQGSSQALAGKLALPQPQMGQTAKVETIGLSPGIRTVRMF
jgi:hypothetical protein